MTAASMSDEDLAESINAAFFESIQRCRTVTLSPTEFRWLMSLPEAAALFVYETRPDDPCVTGRLGRALVRVEGK